MPQLDENGAARYSLVLAGDRIGIGRSGGIVTEIAPSDGLLFHGTNPFFLSVGEMRGILRKFPGLRSFRSENFIFRSRNPRNGSKK
jgi:hypothetical protein